MSAEERALISRASRGDVEAFSKLVSVHSALVRGVTLRMLGGQEAQDASQEGWARGWANIKAPCPLKPFMFAQTLTQTSWLASWASWPPSMRSVTPRTRAEWTLTSFENASTSPREARAISARSSVLIGDFFLSKPSVGSQGSQDTEPESRTALAGLENQTSPSAARHVHDRSPLPSTAFSTSRSSPPASSSPPGFTIQLIPLPPGIVALLTLAQIT